MTFFRILLLLDNMRKKIVFDPQQLVTWSLVTFGLCITVWQCYNCTLQYLAQPVRVEQQFVNIANLPPIQLSICKVLNVAQPIEYSDTIGLSFENSDEDYYGPAVLDTPTWEAGTMPLFANSTDIFWTQLKAIDNPINMSALIQVIEFYNDSSSSWNVLYNETTGEDLFAMAIYPYEGNSTLLCHTLKQGLADFGTQFRLKTLEYSESRNLFIFYFLPNFYTHL
jgi:hypothetical protein